MLVNCWLPGRVNACNLFGCVLLNKKRLARKSEWQRGVILNHEGVHTIQMRETLYLGFYCIYLAEWVYRLIFHTKAAYKGISFEREAFAHQYERFYYINRRKFAMWRKSNS